MIRTPNMLLLFDAWTIDLAADIRKKKTSNKADERSPVSNLNEIIRSASPNRS